MKNKLLRNTLLCICVFLGLILGSYFLLTAYFKRGFMTNTWINGIYCTGMTVEEVNTELLAEAEAPFFTIIDKEDREYEISLNRVDYTLSYTKKLEALYEEQQNAGWTGHLSAQPERNYKPEISIDKEKLQDVLEELAFVQEDSEKEYDMQIQLTEEGFCLYNGLNDRLDREAMLEYVWEQILAGETSADLAEGGCYIDHMPDREQMACLKQWTVLDSYLSTEIVYDMGDELIPLTRDILSGFLRKDEQDQVCFGENGEPMIEESAIESFVNSLADAYNTYGKELTFTSTMGEEKTIPYLTYGTEIDEEKEIAYLMGCFLEKRSETHIPSYKREGYVRGKNDIGGTYIEVDMGNQHLYVYVDGELLVDTDIVTGNEKKKMSTPEGVVSVYNKQRNRTLRGPGYASFVKYWMPVKGGIGMHDASWRRNFGGEIYKTNGSHGCINIPKEVMPEIYENIEIGTPVIMFY